MPFSSSLLPGISNPFEFGGELRQYKIVDRIDELALVVRTMETGGKLFLIGPRRYGKTSILRVDAEVVVLRFDAEAYETIDGLAQAILAVAARRLSGTLEKAGETVKRLFARLRPDVSYDLAEQNITVRFGVVPTAEAGRIPVLTDVLDAVERLATESGRRVAIMIDEFQQVIAEGGPVAERQLWASVQTHHQVAYVFSGSKTRLLNDMTNDPARAFWKLGSRLFLGPIPRTDFLPFLRGGFTTAGFQIDEEALIHILDVAEDVPYNVQQLANVTWEMLRATTVSDTPPFLSPTVVDHALTRLVACEHPSYAQLWNGLTKTQKVVLRAVIDEGGRNLLSNDVLTRHGIASSTMHKTLRTLDTRGLVREEEQFESARFRLEDPFLAAWLTRAQAGGFP